MSQSLASSLNQISFDRKKINESNSTNTTTTTNSLVSPVFQSNLSCVLNDPKKSRAELSTFFTKTWGNSFIDRIPDPLIRLGDFTLNDFENYFLSLRQSEKYGRPRLAIQQQSTNPSEKVHSVLNIPQLFLSSQFTLSDATTFNLVFPGIISSYSNSNEQPTKCRTTSTSSDKSEGSMRRQSTSSSTTTNSKTTSNGSISMNSVTNVNSSKQHSIHSTSRLLQDKYNHYLDEIEYLITRSLATKSDCFHDAVRSHDEIQTFLHQTRDAISLLRCQLMDYDQKSLLNLLCLCRYLRQRRIQKDLLKRLQSLAIVKQTHSQVRNLLTTSDYLSALDLIDVTKEILSTQLNDLYALKFYDQQLTELYLLIISLMREEFQQCLNHQLEQRKESHRSTDYIEEEKFVTILIGLIRVKDDKYLDDIRMKFEQFLFDLMEKTISNSSKEMSSTKSLIKTHSDQSNSIDDLSNHRNSSSTSIHSTSSNSFSMWFRSGTNLIRSMEDSLISLENIFQIIQETFLKHSPKNVSQLNSLLEHFSEKLEDRLIAVLTQDLSNRFQIHFECLSIDEYSQMFELFNSFIKYENELFFSKQKRSSSSSLKTFLQGQTTKFLNFFHDQRKQRLISTLENEQWKQVPIPRSIQNSIDELFQLSSSSLSSNSNGSELLLIENESFVLCSSALHLFMLIHDYCSCAQMLSSSFIIDVEHRLIELLNLFNSKTCQLVLGAGATKLGKIRTISAKILALTCRCLQFIKVLLPKIKSHFDQLQIKAENNSSLSSISSAKQFEQLSKLYSEHIEEIHGKLITIIESSFGDTLSSYEVRAPMPSDCFRTLVTRHINAFYNAVAKIVSSTDLILLFTRLNSIFKQLLSKRLRQLKIANDGGPQHGLLTSDLLYYIKQVQSLPGLEMLELHVDEIWTTN